MRITKPFYLGTYHVTRGQFRQFVKDSGYKTDAEKGDNPGAWGWDAEILILRQLLEKQFFAILNALVAFYFMDQMRAVAAAEPVLSLVAFFW